MFVDKLFLALQEFWQHFWIFDHMFFTFNFQELRQIQTDLLVFEFILSVVMFSVVVLLPISITNMTIMRLIAICLASGTFATTLGNIL